jgi:signal recognition particle subunit SRP68
LVYGKGKVYVKKEITAENAKTVDHLLVLLLDAERAWSYAMELKDESSMEGKHKLKHMAVAKFSKAAKWAEKLRVLCSEKADPQTALEATAYSDYMTGQLLLERENWSQAVVKLLSARTIYTELSAVGSLHDQDMFASRLQDLDPPIRFCKFNAGMTSESADIDIFSASPDLKAKFDEMRAKKALDSAHSFSTSSDSSGGVQVHFAGKFIPVEDEQVQVQCSLVQQAMEKVGFRPVVSLAAPQDSDRARDQAFSAALSAIDASSAAVSKASNALSAGSAKGGNQRVTAASSTGKVSEAKAALSLLKNYLAFQRLICLYMKNVEVVTRLMKSMPSVVGLSIHSMKKASIESDREKEGHKVQEIAHLFDQQLTLVRDLLAVPGTKCQCCFIFEML